MVSQTAFRVNEPVYYHREYRNDISYVKPKGSEESSWTDQCKRVGLVTLPFFSLYKPLSLPLSLAMGGMRTFTSVTQVIESIKMGEAKCISLAVLQTGIAVIALASTLFAHPLGMVISTAHDLVIEVNHLIVNLVNGDYEKAIGSCLGIISNALYLSLFLDGGLELAIASLAIQILVELYHSAGEFSKGNYLEGGGHVVMAMVRGAQLAGQVNLLQTKWKSEKMGCGTRKYQIIDLGSAIDCAKDSGSHCYVTSINEQGQIGGRYLRNLGNRVECIEFIYDKEAGVVSCNSSIWVGGSIGGGMPPHINNHGQLSNLHINDFGDQVFVNEFNHLVMKTSNGSFEIEKTKKWIGPTIRHTDCGWNLKINNNGQIAGVIEVGLNSKKYSVAVFDINKNELTTIPITSSAQFADINDKQQIVGRTVIGGQVKGFIWHKDFDFQIIPNFMPSAINNHSVVVGKTSDGRGAIYENGILRDMGETLGIGDFNSDWSQIIEILDINDQGWMIGWGQKAGACGDHPFLITPLD